MKKTLAVFAILSFLLVQARAFELIDYYTGAWWETSAPKGFTRSAGEISLYFYDDYVVSVDLYYNGAVVNMGSGTFTAINSNYWKITFTTTNNVQFVGTVKKGFAKGTSKTIPPSAYRGQWQAN